MDARKAKMEEAMMQHMQMGKESMAHARTSSLENLNGLSATSCLNTTAISLTMSKRGPARAHST